MKISKSKRTSMYVAIATIGSVIAALGQTHAANLVTVITMVALAIAQGAILGIILRGRRG